LEASIVNYVRTIARDAKGIAGVCGWLVVLRWLWCILLTSRECRTARNLQPADRRMGRGPFEVLRQGARAKLAGPQVFSGIREIWVRDVYLKDNYLQIPPRGLVIDLGANMGNFTNLALAQHADVRVIAVEPSVTLSNIIRESLRMNGWSSRASIKRAFVGIKTEVQFKVASDPDYRDAQYVSETSFLEEFNIQRVDFLKCDIEGSEFFLSEPGSKLLSLTNNLAIEIHPTGGSVKGFLGFLRNTGFEIGSVVEDGSGACIALCRRPGARTPDVAGAGATIVDAAWQRGTGEAQPNH
jgi:FkbM family methyltransferase